MTVVESASRPWWRRALGRLRPNRAKSGTEEQLPWTVPVLGLVVLMLAAAVVLWATMEWLGRVAALPVDPSKAIGGKDYVTAMLDAVKIALSVVAGGGALLALYLAVRRQRTAERDLSARLDAQAHTEDDAKARRVTELYTKAADQLGSDKAPVRLAGLYALERLGQDNPEQRPTIASLWCAYLRMPYTPPPTTAATRATAGVSRPLLRNPRRRTGIYHPEPTAAAPDPVASHAEAVLERDVRLSVQRLIAKHLRPRTPDNDQPNCDYWPEIPELDLTSASLIDLDLHSCVLPAVRMNHATIIGEAEFVGATFTGVAEFVNAAFSGGAWFRDATFSCDASFRGATFTGYVQFRSATFSGDAQFRDATFTLDAGFDNATFSNDAQFDHAIFTSYARFDGATFTGYARFDDTMFTCGAQFRSTTFTRDVAFGGATFTHDSTFSHTIFTCDVGFPHATFNRGAIFDGATFTRSAWFGNVTFNGDTTFRMAVFGSTAECEGARGRLVAGDGPQDAWPPGWTCAAVESTDGDAMWGRLVPVPTVLNQQ